MKRKYKIGDKLRWKDNAHNPQLIGALIKITKIDKYDHVHYDILFGPNTERTNWSTDNYQDTLDNETTGATKLDKVL